jgi:amino acid adenylation domain-containing protein/non-ribosomal peptide synthase protein (TIGR01720 family)
MDSTTGTAPRAGLSDAKRALLEARLKGTAKPVAPRNPIVRRGGGPVLPMAYAQERMWFLDQMEPGTWYYNIPVAGFIDATVDIPTLERALTEIVRRHEAVRTTFRLIDDVPMQIINPPFEIKIEVEDLRGQLGHDRVGDVRRLVTREGSIPFDLATGPLFRAKLFRISDDEYVILLTLHHIITDGWSMPLVTKEMEDIYDAFLKGLPSPYDDLEVQYADYGQWQREYLTGDTLQKQLDYWRGKLEGAPALEMPTDRPRPAEQSFRGDIYRFVMPKRVTDAVKEVSRREGVTMNMTVMTAFNILLQRYSGQDDLVVGTLIGNRNRAETEALIGYFVNTAALRFDLSGDPTFREALARVRNGVLEADEHQDLPFERLVDHLKLDRDLSRHPLFQAMYFHHTFVAAHNIGDTRKESKLEVRPFYENGVNLVDMGISKFDLMLATLEMRGEMPSMIEYSADLFDEATIVRFAQHLETLLLSIGANPDERISRLSITTAVEEAEEARWSQGRRVDTPEVQVQRLFEERAREHPDAVAVSFGGKPTTYGELNAEANRIAHKLREMGAGPETRVGVCLERTPRMLAAVIGALKSGAVYVPLDPRYPAARLAHVLSDSGVPIVLTETAARASLPETSARVVVLDAPGALDGAAETDPEPLGGPDNLMVVIYTSGSTGLPKGVEVTHRAVVDLMHWLHREIPADDWSSVLASTSIAFDVSVGEIFGTLTAGGRLVMVENALELASLPSDEEVKMVVTVPTAAAELLRMGAFDGRVQSITMAGEPLPAALARDLYAEGKLRTVRNFYGPTEDTVYSSGQVMEPGAERSTIGGPMSNARCYVLDADLRPQPVGVPGEMWLAGSGLARGYTNRPALTAESFIPDPFGDPGSRMYRSRDRGRWLPDGTLEVLGRVDTQVKIRGHRIELGEVETVLRAHPGVSDAAVVVREDGGARRLAAYVVGRGDEALTGAALRTHLKERVPEYMVPASITVMDALPLTANGKVDRRALPAPDAARDEAAAEFVEAHGAVEETLARIWAEVLRMEKVGVHDNFFELGGDSILSIQVMSRASQAGLRLTPKQMFQHQTIAELAPVAGTAAQVEAEQGPVTGPAPLTPAQHWFLEMGSPEPHHFNLAFSVDLRDAVDAGTMSRAVAAVLEHHDALRNRFARRADGWTQTGTEPVGEAPFESHDVSAMDAADEEAEMDRRARAAQTSLDIANGPMLRFVHFRRGAGKADRMIVIAHHLVMDAVSWSFVQQDLETAYTQFAAGGDVHLPRKTTSFKRWAERLVEHAASPALRAEAEHWLAETGGGSSPLPVDHAGGENTDGASDHLTVKLSAEDTAALLTDVPQVYGTQINDVLLTALTHAFAGWTGSDELLIDLEGHGREDLFETVDLSRTAGWFTSIFPVRLSTPGASQAGESLKTVKEKLRSVPGKGVGYGILRYLSEDAELRASLAGGGKAQVSFNYLGQFDAGSGAGSFFALAEAELGPARSPRGLRPHLLSVDAMVAFGQLELTWTYGTSVHDRATIQRLGDAYLDAVRALIAHCKDPEAGGFTPSDFEMAGLDQGGLDALMAQLGDLGL